MGCCSAPNCSNSSEKNFRMFRFPSDPERRKKWIANCRREGWSPGPNAQLCSVHFDKDQMLSHRQLKPSAIPNLFNNKDSPMVYTTVVSNTVQTTPSPRKSSRIAQRRILPKQQVESENKSNVSESILININKQNKNEKETTFHYRPNLRTALRVSKKKKDSVHRRSVKLDNVSPRKLIISKPCYTRDLSSTSEPVQLESEVSTTTSSDSTVLTPDLVEECHSVSPVPEDISSETISSDQVLEKKAENLREMNKDIEIANEKLRKRVQDFETEQQRLIKDKKSLVQEIEDFQTNNRGMVHVIYQLQKHNMRMSSKLSELRTERSILKVRTRGVKRQCRELSKLKDVSKQSPIENQGELELVPKIKKEPENS